MTAIKIKLILIPIFIGVIQAKLTADVTDYEIPLLLSITFINKHNKIAKKKDCNDWMIMFQKTVDMIHIDSGHYGILLNNFVKNDVFINCQIS